MVIRPILFSTEMVQAILDGRKTMTRRVVTPQPMMKDLYFAENRSDINAVKLADYRIKLDQVKKADILRYKKAPYQPGDILWVRETWVPYAGENCACSYYGYECKCEPYWYRANWSEDFANECEYPEDRMRWRPSIFMPKEVARLFLRVTDVRVERVQEIGEADAVREGLRMPRIGEHVHDGMELQMICTAQDAFAALWDSLNAKRGNGWDANPWVWVYSFERTDKPEGWAE